MSVGHRPPRASGPRKAAARSANARRFHLAVEAWPTAMVLVDARGRIEFTNAKAQELFGHGVRELEGRFVEALVPARFRVAHRGHRRSFFAEPVARPMGAGRDLFAVRRDGSEFPVEIGLYPVVIEERTLVLVSIVDISERKRAEDRLRLVAEDLARSNADLEQFAYAAAHDLQDPLRMITAHLQLLEKRYGGRDDQQAHQCIEHAVQGARNMGQLIEGLLAYSRAGTSGMNVTALHAERAVTQAVQNLQAPIEARRASVTWKTLPRIEADFVLLVEVFQNLIGNAIKFSTGRPPRVVVSAQTGEKEWTFRVRDNGIGIDPAYAERIFGVFQRLHPRDRFPGSGIGLAICRKVVARHGGSIWLGSSSSGGSEFVFTLPRTTPQKS